MPEAQVTHAECGQCGWLGRISQLLLDFDRPMDDFCPECKSHDVDWLTLEEHNAILKDYTDVGAVEAVPVS